MNSLELDTFALKEQYDAKSSRKLPRFKVSKSPAPFRFDGESPYAEYLPALYKEYKPKEKKLKRKNSNVSMNDFIRKVDQAYSETQSVGGGFGRNSESRDGNVRLARKMVSRKSMKKMGTLRSNSSLASSRGGKSVRSNPARLRKKNKKLSSKGDDSFMKIADMVKQKVMNSRNQ